jgi:hypothetical protein
MPSEGTILRICAALLGATALLAATGSRPSLAHVDAPEGAEACSLPPGHPPVPCSDPGDDPASQLPPGHPRVDGLLPPGHPDVRSGVAPPGQAPRRMYVEPLPLQTYWL